MRFQFRHFRDPQDYLCIDQFLVEHYQPRNEDGNWIEPAWEYNYYHPMMDPAAFAKTGIWEDNGKIVGVAHCEGPVGDAFFQFHPAYRYLREEMLEYAEENLSAWSEEGNQKSLRVYVNDHDPDFQALVKTRGYKNDAGYNRPMSIFEISDPFPSISLPEGFHLQSLADECDWAKVHRVMWRGFNHPGEPPAGKEELESRRKMFDTRSARRDLKIVVAAPNGDFASFCGMFYEPTHHYAYVEPVATDPDFRRMGLGKAAVLEGIRRCKKLGAKVAYVGSDQAFYLSIGFQVLFNNECWRKDF